MCGEGVCKLYKLQMYFFLLVSDDSSRIGAMLVTRCVRSLYSGLIEIEISYDCFSTDR